MSDAAAGDVPDDLAQDVVDDLDEDVEERVHRALSPTVGRIGAA